VSRLFALGWLLLAFVPAVLCAWRGPFVGGYFLFAWLCSHWSRLQGNEG